MRSLRKIDMIENMAMIAVIIIALCICILPNKVLTSFSDEVMMYVERGSEAMYAENWALAEREAREVLRIIEERRQGLCIIVDHKHVTDMLRGAKTAVQAAMLEDKSLYREMMTVITVEVEEIREIEEMSLSVLF